jgi:peptidoglycan-associated lipoprotein
MSKGLARRLGTSLSQTRQEHELAAGLGKHYKDYATTEAARVVVHKPAKHQGELRWETVLRPTASASCHPIRRARQKSNARVRSNEVEDVMKKSTTLVFVLAAILMVGACNKKVAPAPSSPPPPPPAPTASLSANPNTVEKGQSTTLTWQTTNATDVSIVGIGIVDGVAPNGSRLVAPEDSTTYHLTAKGAGGIQEANARVTVVVSAPPPPRAPSPTEEELFSQNVKDTFFDYDKYDIRADQQGSLQADAQFLQQHPNIRFSIEGYCDERGSIEYNLVLGTSRADAVKNALTQAGITGDRIETISYGKEKRFCTDHAEDCWQQNRRGHFVYGN